MVQIEPFAVEQWMDEYETKTTYNIAETCSAPISIEELQSFSSEPSTTSPIPLSTKLTYGSIRGTDEILGHLSHLYSVKTPSPLPKDNILITTGAIQGNFLLHYALVGPGDHVIVHYPTYQQLYSVSESIGAEVSLWKAKEDDKWSVDTKELEALIRPNTKLIVLNNPQNPTGATIPRSKLQEIVDIAERHSIIIHGDEVYRPLFHSISPADPEFPPSLLSMGYENTVVTSSMSKAYSLAGIRVGWIASRNKEIIDKCMVGRDYTTISVSHLDDAVASYALAPHTIHNLLSRNIQLAQKNLEILDKFIESHRWACDWVKPRAGTTAFVRFSKMGRPVDDVVLCQMLNEKVGVLVVPGAKCFGRDGDFQGYVRIGYVCETEVLEQALAKLREFMQKEYVDDVPLAKKVAGTSRDNCQPIRIQIARYRGRTGKMPKWSTLAALSLAVAARVLAPAETTDYKWFVYVSSVMPPLPNVPVKYAAPAVATLLAYLNARWSFFYDYKLVSSLIAITLKVKLAARQDRLSMFYVLEKHALAPKSANRPFIVYNGQTWTYHEAYQTVLRYGQYFKQTLGVQPKEIVAMDYMNSANFIFIWLGLTSIGAVPAFINYNLSGKPLTHCVKVATARVLVADEEVRDKFSDEQLAQFASPDFRDGKGGVKVVFVTRELEHQILKMPAIREEDSARSAPEPKSMAMLIYTSGTTGNPKPAIVSLQKCWAGGTFIDHWLNLRTDDRIFTCMPLYHATAGILAFVAVLLKGSTIIIGHRFSARNFFQEARENDATIVQYVGETMRYLLAAPRQIDPVTGEDLDKKHKIRLAYGNGMRPDVWNQVKERFGIDTIGEFYSATEGFSGHWNLSANDYTAGAIGRNGLVGELILGRTMAVVEVDHENQVPWRDPATGFCRRVPRGDAGELLYAVDANNISEKFQGYYNNPKASESKILRDVFAKGDAWFRTGDTLRWDVEGRWYFTDRIGDTFRWKSENVSTNEVAEIVGSHPEVFEANVYGVSLPHHDGRAGCAAIVFKSGYTDVPHDILDSLAAQVVGNLPRYALPLFLRVTTELERTGNNKQQKHVLREQGVDPAKVSASDRMYWLQGDKYVPFTPADWERLSAAQVRL